MNILVIAATHAEIGPLIEYMGNAWSSNSDGTYSKTDTSVQILTTGVGMVAMSYHLSKALNNNRCDLVLLLGIAGSFNRNISLGELVLVRQEKFGDMGAEDHYNLLDVFELGLEKKDRLPFSDGFLSNPTETIPFNIGLPEVSGITINTVSGSSFTATSRFEKYTSQTESMEGAAFHYVCLLEKVPFAQVRCISNYVEARDKSKWEIGLALKNLNDWAISFLENIAIS